MLCGLRINLVQINAGGFAQRRESGHRRKSELGHYLTYAAQQSYPITSSASINQGGPQLKPIASTARTLNF